MASTDFYIQVEDHTGQGENGLITYPVAFECEGETLLLYHQGFLLQVPNNQNSLKNILNICQKLIDLIEEQEELAIGSN